MDWFVQSLLSFGGWGHTVQVRFNIPDRDKEAEFDIYVQIQQTVPCSFSIRQNFVVRSLGSEIWELSSAENMDSFCSSYC